MFSVNLWGSKPGTNDDCHSGTDHETHEAALAAYNQPRPSYIAWIELDGPDVHEERENPDYKPSYESDDDWRREARRQAGMELGPIGYNDYEGY